MNIREILNTAKEKMPNAEHEAQWICSHYLELSNLDMSFLANKEVTAEQEKAVWQAVKRRQNGEPLQYIFGEQPFMDFTLKVTPDTLIPRWDSEVVVEKAVSLIPKGEPWRVADICTGCGTYALSLKYYRPDISVQATDISAEALRVAEENSARLNLPVEFLQGNLAEPLTGKFEMIVANPPYIATDFMKQLDEDVLREPHLALDGGADGLDFYRLLALTVPEKLQKGGLLLLEIGCDQCGAVCKILNKGGFTDLRFGKDYGANDRWVLGVWSR